MRVLVALTEPADRTVVREAVREAEGFEILAYAGTGTEAVQMSASTHPDVVLLGGSLPLMDGYQAARMITLHSPGTRVIIADSSAGVAQMQKAMSAGARATLSLPLQADDLLEALTTLSEQERERDRAEFVQATDPSRAPVTVAVCGSKGGSGKTTVAVNLAVALAKLEPGSVALVDLYQQFGDIHSMLDARPKRTLADLVVAGEELDPDVLRQMAVPHASGLAVFIATLTPQPLDLFTPAFVEALLGAMRQAYRFIVLDIPPMLHGGTLAALSRAEHVLPICCVTEVTAAASTRCYMDVLAEGYVSAERLHVVANRTGRGMPLQISEVEEALGRPVSVTIPNDERRILTSINEGAPAVISQAGSPAAQAITALARRIHGREPVSDRAPGGKQKAGDSGARGWRLGRAAQTPNA